LAGREMLWAGACKGEEKGGAGSVTGAAGEREAFARPSRRPPMPHPAPAHKSFSDRTSLYQEITDKIVVELEQGRVPWVQPWRGVSALLGLPRNAGTGRQYTGINILILWCAVAERGFISQNWLTFRQALKIGAHVRKGEKGTTVVYADRFIPYRERTRAAEAGDEPEAIPFLKRFTVFNADQCADLPADLSPPQPPLAENLILPQAEAFIRATGADLRIGGNRAFYVPRRLYPGAAARFFLRADQFSPDGFS
jgi:antirestriction protein ArdC